MDLDFSPSAWAAHAPQLEALGVIFPEAKGYLSPEMKRNVSVAMDALPALSTTANASFPALFTTYVDPEIVRIAFAPVAATKIASERKMGDWTMDTAMFNVVEATGETAAYGDFVENGRSGINQNFPQRQSFHFQVIEEYGERELDRAALTKLNYVSEINRASAENLSRYSNYSYFFGINGLQNYGLINDPTLPAWLTPSTKANGGVQWVKNGTINATANEIFNDIQAMVYQLVNQSAGVVTEEDELVMALAPQVRVALNTTNSFGLNVYAILKDNFPKLRIETAVQYGAISSANPQGLAAGNLVQLFATKYEGNDTVFCAFTEKMRGHKLEVRTSSYKRKITSGTWGTVWRYPVAQTGMIGV
jgi:hypothetical protein